MHARRRISENFIFQIKCNPSLWLKIENSQFGPCRCHIEAVGSEGSQAQSYQWASATFNAHIAEAHYIFGPRN